jgi:hypothetical protein
MSPLSTCPRPAFSHCLPVRRSKPENGAGKASASKPGAVAFVHAAFVVGNDEVVAVAHKVALEVQRHCHGIQQRQAAVVAIEIAAVMHRHRTGGRLVVAAL